MSRDKALLQPKWWKNTYFWISAVLFALGIAGVVFGEDAIRDPAQKLEHGLPLLYFVASIVMLVGGLISHRQTVQHYNEETGAKS